MYIPLEIPFPRIDPAAFTIPLPDMQLGPLHLGPFPVRWYALGYIFGLLGGWWYAVRMVSTARLWGEAPQGPLKKQDIDDFAFYAMIGILLGGRIGYILFYTIPFEPEKLTGDPTFILRMWEGGMSFHGGFLGCVAAVMLFALKNNISILSLGDITTAVAPIGIFLGRIANFIKGELWGREADASVSWRMIFPDDPLQLFRHPSQLYEAALEGLLLFLVLAVMVRMGALRRPGLILGSFIALYAFGRIASEFFREPDPQLGFLWGGLTMGMLLSVPMIVVGGILIARAWRGGARTPIQKST